MKLMYPVASSYPITQTFAQHEARADANHWCKRPGNCPGGVWYYGGIDYGVPINTPIRAAADGKVLDAVLSNSGYGNYVRIQHTEGYQTVYGHNSFLLVGKGDTVKAGDIISLSGSTGNSTGPHLHFEVRKNNIPVNPQPLLDSLVPPVITPPVIVPGSTATVDAVPYLNIRLTPSGDIVGRLPNGSTIQTRNTVDGWTEVILYVSSDYLR